jgi:hypothetical protein
MGGDSNRGTHGILHFSCVFFRAQRGKTHKMIDTYHAAAGEKRIFGYPLGDAE